MGIYLVEGVSLKKSASLAMSLDIASYRQIAAVGGGGKTTILKLLAEELSAQNKQAILTTTTHIYLPADNCYAADCQQAEALLGKRKIITVGKLAGNNKLGYIGDSEFAALRKIPAVLLVEADGSRQLPLKVPDKHEPVVPEGTELTIGVIGIDCLGFSLAEKCHRSKLAAELLKKPVEAIITPEDIAKLINSQQGLFKGCRGEAVVIINKVNCQQALERVSLISRLVNRKIIAVGWHDEY